MDIISKNPTFFQNEHKLPLNHLSLSIATIKRLKKVDPNKDLSAIRDNLADNYEAKRIKVPALDPHWIQKSRSYNTYQPYFVQVSAEENACFSEKNKLFLQSVQFLLSCSYHQFWCYIIYEERVKVVLDSFVMNAIPWYELKYLNNEHKKLYCEIYENVARIFSRMLNDKETDMEYMTEPYRSNLLVKHKIITFTHITQLFLLYDQTNPKIVQQLLRICDNVQSKFHVEIEKMFEHVKTVLDIINNQFSMHRSSLRLCTTFITPRPEIFDPNWFDEIVLYLLDTAATLNSFIRNRDDSLSIAVAEHLPLHVARFYNGTFPLIYQAFEDQGDLPDKYIPLKERIFENIAIARMEFVNFFHQVATLYLNKIQMNKKRDLDEESLENYLGLISNILEEEFFIFDYHNSHRIDLQLENIITLHPNVDRTRLNYIKQCVCNLPELGDLLEKQLFDQQNEPVSSNQKNTVLAEFQQEEPKLIKDDKEVEELIREVLDTLPHLGDAYILECLHYYNFSTTDVISAILDGAVPCDIIRNAPHAIRVPPEQPEPTKQPIMAFKGKKPTYKDAKDMLDDKKEVVAKVRDIILSTRSSIYDQYDDEYDDRDDESPASVAAYNKRMRGMIAEDDNDPYKYMQNRFAGMDVVSDPSSSDEGTEEVDARAKTNKGYRGGRGGGGVGVGVDNAAAGGSGYQNKGAYRKPDFCENPELVRERWAAGRHPGNARDVTGRPRGQGQEATVQHNRDKKNTNKSSRANHNRKSGATFKRSKGLIP